MEAEDTITSSVWNFGDGSASSTSLNPEYTYNSPGIYNVSLLVNGTTTITATDQISVFESPEAEFIYTDSAEAGPYSYNFSKVIHDSSVSDYFWDFGDGTQEYTSYVFHSFSGNDLYNVQLIVENIHGCRDTFAKSIQVIEQLVIPNVFTPNGDGLNDYFIVSTTGLNTWSFSVYTRSGILVYQSETPTIFWDGRTQSGIEVHPGIYYYIIRQVETNESTEKSGVVHVFR
jgi:gliding motility-associated-like protein